MTNRPITDSYIVKKGDIFSAIAKDNGVSLQELKKLNPEFALRDPNYNDIRPGDIITLPFSFQPKEHLAVVCQTCHQKCTTHELDKPFLIATAVASSIIKQVTLPVNDDVLHGATIDLGLGQDITHSSGRSLPAGCRAADYDEQRLKQAMLGLLNIFASSDSEGTSKRLFNDFLKKQREVQIFTDDGLNKAVAQSFNFIGFADLTLGAPQSGFAYVKSAREGNAAREGIGDALRIHQSLRKAGWDINRVKLIEGLGPPAFNRGNQIPFLTSEDWANGLAAMINGVQYVFVYVEGYSYDSCKSEYDITLKFVLYDVFGLDDEDLRKNGLSSSSRSNWQHSPFLDAFAAAGIGAGANVAINHLHEAAQRAITAWWQLQHQFNYVPLLTKAVVYRSYRISTRGQ